MGWRSVAWIVLAVACCGAGPVTWDTAPDTWVAVDRQGRALPTSAETGPPRRDRTLAMFYFLWSDAPGRPLYDVTRIQAADPLHPKYGPEKQMHWWGEPWLGYYTLMDPAVVRKHVQMLVDAGVDVLIFDETNGPKNTYPAAREAVCRELEDRRARGEAYPKIAFFCGGNFHKVFHEFYLRNRHPDLWFRWLGKPLMLVHQDDRATVTDDMRQFFTLRESWAWAMPGQTWFGTGADRGRDCWPWLDNWPQSYGWHTDPTVPEEISVTVAQHATSSIGRSFSFQHGGEPPLGTVSPTRGIYFAEQWERALAVDPQVVFVAGWNEWMAQRFIAPATAPFAGGTMAAGDSYFTDEYDAEFSRDIEPAKGELQDDYYYQLVANARRYKGTRTVEPAKQRSIAIDGGFGQWATVTPEYRDDIGDAVHRDAPGWGDTHYTNQTGRNDLVAAKVTYDADHVYFYVRTADPLTPHTGPNWMLLYLSVAPKRNANWLGYDFVVNRAVPTGQTTRLQRSTGGGYRWADVADVPYTAAGNELQVAVPRSVLGLAAGPVTLDFKWADNIQQTGDASDFTLNGDAAPNDRFSYHARLGG
jgi:hypothetical protein